MLTSSLPADLKLRVLYILLLPVLLLTGSAAVVADSQNEAAAPGHVPCDNRTELRQVFFGDTHVHTAWSLDAATQDTRNKPVDAYRFAKGQKVGIQPYDRSGMPLRFMQLQRPLDYAVVTDHAEMLGEVNICSTPGSKGYYSIPCMIHRYLPKLSLFVLMGRASSGGDRFSFCGKDGEHCLKQAEMPWQDIQQAAENAYDRSAKCSFTSFIGYEWTGSTLENLHRNVIFRNNTVPYLPVSFFEENTPEGLWQRLAERCTGACDLLIIPHNSNLSGGLMYQTVGQKPLTNAQAAQRARLEPLVELMQHKGSSECWYGAGVSDELCAFEKLPYRFFRGKFTPGVAKTTRPTDGYVRQALLEGLRYADQIGANPYRIGFIGSTDTHLGLPGAVSSINYPGHGGAGKSNRKINNGLVDALEYNPGGIAAVWAEENTRESIFRAMRRRETYSTSGPRIRLRFFGGWQYDRDLCQSDELVAAGYRDGIAMGGLLPVNSERSGAPQFVVRAHADPGTGEQPGLPLQRIQMIKGWLDENGRPQTRIYEVAGNPNNGAGVAADSCEPRGSGFKQLCTVWQDPDFSHNSRAYYYVRVLENPSCRWSARACNKAGVDCSNPDSVPESYSQCCSSSHRKTVQQRATSSPIWYDSSIY